MSTADTRLALQAMQRGSVSFTLASWLFPAETRADVALLYQWLRACDDLVDEGPPEGAAQAVAQMQARVERVLRGAEVPHPEDAALQDVLRRHPIPEVYLREFLAGMESDAHGRRPRTVRDLLEYCYRVAGTVGLMMCHVMGVRDAAALRHAVHMGMAMQLTNICRDIRDDWLRGRLYVPADMLERHGAARIVERVGGPLRGDDAAVLDACAAELWTLARGYYASGDRGVRHLPFRASLAVAAARAIYSAIGVALARRNFNVLGGRVVLSRFRKIALLARAVGRRMVAAVVDRVPAANGPGRPLVFVDVEEVR